jgi:hypothetical protein
MFDFVVVISPHEGVKVRHNQRHEEHLEPGDYKYKYYEGNAFSAEAFFHADMPTAGYRVRNQVHVFVTGKVYTNRYHAQQTGKALCLLSDGDILELYMAYGPDMVRRIKGTFAILIADETRNKYYAFVNRSGLIKLFHYTEADKVIVSTSISSILNNMSSSPVVDEVSLIEHGMFGHTFGSNTCFRGIRIQDNFSYLCVEGLSSQEVAWFSMLGNTSATPSLDWEETKRELPRQFASVMDCITPREAFNSAITAGYDSRTVLSYLLGQHHGKYRLYSWAADERYYDVAIARQICERLGLDYIHVQLGDEMLARYPWYSKQHVYWTDGMGSIDRTNQMYSHALLARYSRDLMTGYFGSELLRPLHRLNIMVKELFIDLLLGKSGVTELADVYLNMTSGSGFTSEFLQRNRDEYLERTTKHFMQYSQDSDPGDRMFTYLIKSGFWKFFGQEFHAQRIHTRMQSPYMDDDFVDFLLITAVPQIHRGTYKRDPRLLLRCQALYNPIIKANCPDLMYIPTNRGFAPADYDSWTFPVGLMVKFMLTKHRKHKHKIAGFVGYDWSKLTYNADSKVIESKTDVFAPLTRDMLNDGSWYSLKKWIMDSTS